jgi:hypothetical protein
LWTFVDCRLLASALSSDERLSCPPESMESTMSRRAIALVFLVMSLAACAPAVPEPSPLPSSGPIDPAASPTEPILPSPEPSTEPSPAPPSSPAPAALTTDERYLLSGVRRGAIDCGPARDRLPINAIAGIDCASDDPRVDRVGFYLFEDDDAMLGAYMARMTVELVLIDSGTCADGEAEGAYTPWAEDEEAPYRQGCFLNAAGYGNYRATLPGEHVYIGVLGRSADLVALEDFAWEGNRDTPGSPTLWGSPAN